MRCPQASFEAQPRFARLLAPKMGIGPYNTAFAVRHENRTRLLSLHIILRNDCDLLQLGQVAGRFERGVFRNACLVETGVCDVSQQQAARIERRAGRDDLVVILTIASVSR